MPESKLSTGEQFYASKSRPTAKTRLWLWSGLAIGLALLTLKRDNFAGTVFRADAVTVSLIVMSVLLLRRQLKPGKPVIILDDTRIESPNFSGKSKRYCWEEIVSADIVSINGEACLQILLLPTMWRPDKRRFWIGPNPARPFMPLAPFSPEVQERLLDAINLRLATVRSVPAGAARARL